MSKIQGLTDLENTITVPEIPCIICRLCGKRIQDTDRTSLHASKRSNKVLRVHRECGKALVETNSWEDDD